MPDWSRVMDLASSDSKFRSKLKIDALAACRDVGCYVAPGSSVRVIEQKTGEVHFVLGSETNVPEIDSLLELATTDTLLRRQLLEHATQILQPAAGQHFPADTRFFVHERQPRETLIFLRDEQDDGQLDESQLDAIAGGLSKPDSRPQKSDTSNGIIAIMIG